jgi:SAM-dependent methyltransferase
MSTQSVSVPKIFVSYSHTDDDWMNRLDTYLNDFKRDKDLEIFDDRRIEAGQPWLEEINAALTGTSAAILLVSQAYLGSTFIRDYELPVFLSAAGRDDCRIFVVIVDRCRWKENPGISRLKVINPDKSLRQLGGHHSRVYYDLTVALDKWWDTYQVSFDTSSQTIASAVSGPTPSNADESTSLSTPDASLAADPFGDTADRDSEGPHHDIAPALDSISYPDGAGYPVRGSIPDSAEAGAYPEDVSADSASSESDGFGSHSRSEGAPESGEAESQAHDDQRIDLEPWSIYRVSILDLMCEYLKPSGIDLSFARRMKSGMGLTIRELEKLCFSRFKSLPASNISRLLEDARAWAYGMKYGGRTSADDERIRFSVKWVDEIQGLLAEMPDLKSLSEAQVLNVGIGNGPEGIGFYDQFETFTGADISAIALQQAQRHYPYMRRRPTSAERLADIGDETIDLYLSFRTYQSSLLDKGRALFAAERVLKPGGHLIISIPHRYAEGDRLRAGLIRPNSETTAPVLDLELPYTHVGEIRRLLFRLCFEEVGEHSGKVEHYIYARKPLEDES